MDLADVREEIEDSLNHIIPRKPFPQGHIDDAVFLEVQNLLSQHPDESVKAWSEKPRLYTLLRMLGYDDESPVFQKIQSEQINDFWLPLNFNTLKQLSSSIGVSPQEWRHAQLRVCSKAELMSEGKLLSPEHAYRITQDDPSFSPGKHPAPTPAHRYIREGASFLEDLEQIGKGGTAEVARVRHKQSGRQQFACKRILRAHAVTRQREQLREFIQEVGVLMRIRHQHVVELVASFTDLSSFSLILNPVASDSLASMLERQTRDRPLPEHDFLALRQAFGCLATALDYLHGKSIRHKDIKPQNILLSEGRVYLCDFGISLDWSDTDHSTTEGEVLKVTKRYCAPEVFDEDPRNAKSDIWALGCVFLELLSVVKGYPFQEVTDFLLEHKTEARSQGLWCAPDALNAWVVKIRNDKKEAIDRPLDWIVPMTRSKPEDRPTASELVDLIHERSSDLPHPGLFLNSCCARADSLTPADVNYSPTSSGQFSNGLGIQNAPTSPFAPNPSSDLPHRHNISWTSDKNSNTPPSRNRHSSDRSVSPGARGLSPRESTESASFSKDPTSDQSSTSASATRSLHHADSRSDSVRTTSLFSSRLPGSDPPSRSDVHYSPVPPPASFPIKCACARRPNERHIFNTSYVSSGDEDVPIMSFEFDADTPTIETCSECEVGVNKVQIYEGPPHDPVTRNSPIPMVWWVTRRLVVSYLSGNPGAEMRRCSSFWLPLADIRVTLFGNAVMIRWSDCNKISERKEGNYVEHYDWIYDPETPNNNVTIRFNNLSDAQKFIDTVRLPYEDGVTVSHGRRVTVSDDSELYVADVGRPRVRNYRIASLTTNTSVEAVSKLFILWPQIDLLIRKQYFQLTVELRNVNEPTYLSDLLREPSADVKKIAKFDKAVQRRTSLVVAFPASSQQALPRLPQAIVDTLYELTGWTICYFGTITKLKIKKRIRTKKYGTADVMLWRKEVDDSTIGAKRCGFVFALRLHEEMDILWISGNITQSTTVSCPTGLEVPMTITDKTKGKLMDMRTMTAIDKEPSKPSVSGHTRSTSDAQEDQSDLILTFADDTGRWEFVQQVRDLTKAASHSAPLVRVGTSVDSLRRNDSYASTDFHVSSPKH